MPTYDYRCEVHGDFEQVNRMKDHAVGTCPECESKCSQVVKSAPVLDTEAMADCGFPGAFEKSGDRMTKRHQAAGQYHHEEYWRNQ